MIKDALNFVYDKAGELADAKEARHLSWLSDPRTTVYEHNGGIEKSS